MKSLQILGLFVFLLPNLVSAQSKQPAEQIVKNSIQYHDPQGLLFAKAWTMHFEDSRPDGSTRKAYFKFNPKNYDFEMMRTLKSHKVILSMKGGHFSSEIKSVKENAALSDISPESTSEERALMMRNYYHYLWCLPMKLNDPGTIIGDEVKTVDFFGKESLEVKITYTPKVGKDIWYFYFHPNTYAMQGYRFYHDESINDGEYITLDNEVSSNGVRIPQVRKWYTHKEAKFLGEDKLVQIEFH